MEKNQSLTFGFSQSYCLLGLLNVQEKSATSFAYSKSITQGGQHYFVCPEACLPFPTCLLKDTRSTTTFRLHGHHELIANIINFNSTTTNFQFKDSKILQCEGSHISPTMVST